MQDKKWIRQVVTLKGDFGRYFCVRNCRMEGKIV